MTMSAYNLRSTDYRKHTHVYYAHHRLSSAFSTVSVLYYVNDFFLNFIFFDFVRGQTPSSTGESFFFSCTRHVSMYLRRGIVILSVPQGIIFY
jgi:hypothetical protein